MFRTSAPNRRIQYLIRILNSTKPNIAFNNIRTYVSKENVSIGNTIKELKPANCPAYVPRNYCKVKPTKYVKEHTFSLNKNPQNCRSRRCTTKYVTPFTLDDAKRPFGAGYILVRSTRTQET